MWGFMLGLLRSTRYGEDLTFYRILFLGWVWQNSWAASFPAQSLTEKMFTLIKILLETSVRIWGTHLRTIYLTKRNVLSVHFSLFARKAFCNFLTAEIFFAVYENIVNRNQVCHVEDLPFTKLLYEKITKLSVILLDFAKNVGVMTFVVTGRRGPKDKSFLHF